jgi:hypothetical protein
LSIGKGFQTAILFLCETIDQQMGSLPQYIRIIFILTTVLTVWLFYRLTNRSARFLVIAGVWLLFQSILSLSGFFTVIDTVPPRFILLLAPPLLFIAVIFLTPAGRRFIDSLNLKNLTLLHIVRVPVELILYGLFLHHAVPGLLTFEGRNFDIIAGLSAPLVFYLGFAARSPRRILLLTWNILCLALLLNIVAYAILSAPFSFQRLAFEQPNIAVFYFPFTLLPGCIVPLVLFSHLVAIRQILRNDRVD